MVCVGVGSAMAAWEGWLLVLGGAGSEGAGSAGGVRVVVGCDARHRSAEFADEAARVLAGGGIAGHMLPQPGPTPLPAFAGRHPGAPGRGVITPRPHPRPGNRYKLDPGHA